MCGDDRHGPLLGQDAQRRGRRARSVQAKGGSGGPGAGRSPRGLALVLDPKGDRLFGPAKITTGPTVYAFKQLPGWVDDGSVRVSSTAGRILDVRVSRSYLARATERNHRKAEAHARALAHRTGALDDELKVLDA